MVYERFLGRHAHRRKFFEKNVHPLDKPITEHIDWSIRRSAPAMIRGRSRGHLMTTIDGEYRDAEADCEHAVDVVITGEERLVSLKAERELGQSLLVALHVDQPPINFNEPGRPKPHFDVYHDGSRLNITANLRGHGLPASA